MIALQKVNSVAHLRLLAFQKCNLVPETISNKISDLGFVPERNIDISNEISLAQAKLALARAQPEKEVTPPIYKLADDK